VLVRVGIVAKTEDALEARVRVNCGALSLEQNINTAAPSNLSKVLAADREVSDAEVVLGDEALHGASSAPGVEPSAIRLVGGGSTEIVLQVGVTRRFERVRFGLGESRW
jgi:hypothetical protein